MLTQYEQVRIVRLLRPLEEYDGWRVNRRAPHIGDVGTIIDTLQGTNFRLESTPTRLPNPCGHRRAKTPHPPLTLPRAAN